MEDATLIKHPKLFILRAKANGEEYPLHGEMLVGREADCSIPLKSSHVSRYHAKINVSTNGVYVEDLHSTNGTFVNGSKIKGRVRLNLGDEIGFDDLYFKLAASGTAETALSPSRRSHETAMATPPPVIPMGSVSPIRPSLVNHQLAAQKGNRDNELALAFPKADDIDLERPPLSRQSLEDEPDYEQHLEQGFSELDALLQDQLDEPAPPHNPLPAEPAAPTYAEAKIAASEEHDPIPAAQLNPVIEPPPQLPQVEQTPYAPQPSMPEVEDRTQILSSAQLDQFIERHRHEQDINIGSGPRFIVTTAPLRGKLFSLQELVPGSSVQLGRDTQSEIYLNDLTISTDHARITKSDGGYTLSATNAKNGIIVNGVSQNRVLLKHNDKIQIGRTELVFKTDMGANEPTRPQPDDLLVNHGQGRRYSILITVIAMAVLVGAIIATSR